MTYFLAKTDPETYSIEDMEREKKTVWDGVTNPQAVRAIKEMQPGDRVFLYHSGGNSGVVGLAVVRGAGRPIRRIPSRRWRISSSPEGWSLQPPSRRSSSPENLRIGRSYAKAGYRP